MMNTQVYKIVVLGQGKYEIMVGRVGKTSLSLRYVRGQFNDNEQSTINAVYLQKIQKTREGKAVKFAIWDTAGQQKYNAIAPVYYRDAVGAIIVYEIISNESFEKVKKWIKQLSEYASKNIVVIVCGNKCDMENQRKVNNKQAQNYAKSYSASHYLVSAKSGAGIQEAFSDLADKIYKVKTANGNSMMMSGLRGRNIRQKIDNQKVEEKIQQEEEVREIKEVNKEVKKQVKTQLRKDPIVKENKNKKCCQ